MLKLASVREDVRVVADELPAEEVELGSEARCQGPVRLALKLYRMGRKILINGTVEARVRLACSRCLRELEKDVLAPLLLVAIPAGQAEGDVKEAADDSGPADEALVFYDSDQLDLIPEIQSALWLSLPMKPLCEETCPGLCPNCGERMTVDHVCRPAGASGPFSGLRDFQ